MRCRLLLGVLVLWALSAGRASANDFDGIWVGGYAPAGGKITMQAEFVGGLARFEIELWKWVGYGDTATCQYYARLDDNAWGELILNSGASSKQCARRGQVSVMRLRPDWTLVSFAGFKNIPDFTLHEVIRPLGQAERATLPDNFDILGVSLGMTREEIEKNLIDERGFVVVSQDSDLRLHRTHWVAEIITYRQGAKNGPRDEVIVAYSIRYQDDTEGQDHAIMVRRESHLGQDSDLTVDVLREALTRKYGPPTEDDNRRYGRDGRSIRGGNDPIEFCEPGNRHHVESYFLGISQALRSHCGSELDVHIETDRSTGFVNEYKLSLISVDYINDNQWVVIAINIREEIETFLEAMEGAATSGPEL